MSEEIDRVYAHLNAQRVILMEFMAQIMVPVPDENVRAFMGDARTRLLSIRQPDDAIPGMAGTQQILDDAAVLGERLLRDIETRIAQLRAREIPPPRKP